MWATDASYFRVVGWGFYYMVTVMDDFSRFILSWKLQRDMTADSFSEVVQDAVDLTGMTEVPLDDRTRALVSLPNCCSLTMGLGTSPEHSETTCVCWESDTSWLHRTTLRPMAR